MLPLRVISHELISEKRMDAFVDRLCAGINVLSWGSLAGILACVVVMFIRLAR